MESFLFVYGTLLVLLLITNSKAYNNLLENSKILVYTEEGRPGNGAENTIDGNASTCLHFYRSTLQLNFDFTVVQSFYEVAVSLDSDSWFLDYVIRLSIYVSHSSSVEVGSLCDSEYLTAAYRRFDVERKCVDQGRFIVLKILSKIIDRLPICDIRITDRVEQLTYSTIASIPPLNLRDCTEVNECPNGTYGYQCNSSCGNCKDMTDCDHVTGYCIGGCDEGSMGLTCDKECPYGFYGKECSDRCNMSCGFKSEQQSIPEETNTCKLTSASADFNKTTVYAMGSALTLSLLVNILFAAMCIIRSRVKKKNDVYDKNDRGGHRQDRENNKSSEGMELDQQNVQYEAVGIPCQETHYDDLE